MKKVIAITGILFLCGLAFVLRKEALRKDSVAYTTTPIQANSVSSLVDPKTDPSKTNSPLPTAIPAPTPTATVSIQATPPPSFTWSPTPVCQNEPRDITYWKEMAAEQHKGDSTERKLRGYLHRMPTMDTTFAGSDADGLKQILNLPETSPAIDMLRRDRLVVWLNILSGRLNRASKIKIPGLSDVHTVGDLLANFEHTLADGPRANALDAGIRRLVSGQGITRSVCAHTLHLRFDNQFQQRLWTDTQISTESISSELLGSRRWLMERLIPSRLWPFSMKKNWGNKEEIRRM